MTDWNYPSLAQLWSDFVAAIKGRSESNAKQDYSSDSNIPDQTVRFNRSTNKWEEWDAGTSSWGDLASKYNMNVEQVDGRDVGNASGQISVNNGSKNIDLNADQLDGLHASNVATPNTLLALDANGKLPASVTGSANSSKLVAPDGSPDPALIVDNDGNIGIGTSSPSGNLHIAGSSNPFIRLEDTGSGGANYFIQSRDGYIRIGDTDGEEHTVVLDSGKVGIGLLDPSAKLEVNGDIKANNIITWYRKTSNSLVASNRGYKVDAGLVMTLPPSPSDNDRIYFSPLGNMTSSPATISRNGNNIMGLAEDMTWDANVGFGVIFDSINNDWRFI